MTLGAVKLPLASWLPVRYSVEKQPLLSGMPEEFTTDWWPSCAE